MKLHAILFLLVGLTSSSPGQTPGTSAPPPPAQPAIFARIYKVDTNAFTIMRRSVTATNDAAVLRRFCKQRGIDLSPPSAFFYSYGEKSLIVRSTLENLDRLEELLTELQSTNRVLRVPPSDTSAQPHSAEIKLNYQMSLSPPPPLAADNDPSALTRSDIQQRPLHFYPYPGTADPFRLHSGAVPTTFGVTNLSQPTSPLSGDRPSRWTWEKAQVHDTNPLPSSARPGR